MKIKRYRLKDSVEAYIFLLPLLIGVSIFYIYPFFQNVFFSFTNLGSFGVYKVVGLANYKRLFQDPLVTHALANTLKYAFLSVPLTITFALYLALLLNYKIKGKGLFRTLLFLPTVTISASVALMWKWIYDRDFGILNRLLSSFNIPSVTWLGDNQYAFWAILAVIIWMGVGYAMIIILAGLQGISSEYYEVAYIEGASFMKRFFSITLPLLTPVLFFLFVVNIIAAFQIFDLIYLMIKPNSVVEPTTQSMVSLFYKYAFSSDEKGYATSITMILFLIIMAITLLQMKLQKRWVFYE